VEALLAELREGYDIDPQRVYAAGFSNGGMFALRLACALSERIAALGVVSGVMAEPVLANCAPGRPVPVVLIHGTADADLPWEGKSDLASVPETVAAWVRLNGCRAMPAIESWDREQDGTAIRRERYGGCTPGSSVELYAVEEGGHRWPGGSALWQYWLSGKRSEELDAGQVLWRFFAERP
jgi:polyhydroxybutyrate depolymerase